MQGPRCQGELELVLGSARQTQALRNDRPAIHGRASKRTSPRAFKTACYHEPPLRPIWRHALQERHLRARPRQHRGAALNLQRTANGFAACAPGAGCTSVQYTLQTRPCSSMQERRCKGELELVLGSARQTLALLFGTLRECEY